VYFCVLSEEGGAEEPPMSIGKPRESKDDLGGLDVITYKPDQAGNSGKCRDLDYWLSRSLPAMSIALMTLFKV
jgi:hypothetical protein